MTKFIHLLVLLFSVSITAQNGYELMGTITDKATQKPLYQATIYIKELKKGYGIGVRLNTPIGPLRFDYGWPMDPEKKGEKKDKGKFYFSFGQSF